MLLSQNLRTYLISLGYFWCLAFGVQLADRGLRRIAIGFTYWQLKGSACDSIYPVFWSLATQASIASVTKNPWPGS
jgi:hypothetical protein